MPRTNPQRLPTTKVRMFDGIGGPRTQILKRFNGKGWDISNTVCNDIQDLHLAERGSAFLRPGMRRLGSEDYTIGWIGQMNLGGLLRYGVIYNNSLTMVDMPDRLDYELIEWPEDEEEKPTDWPDGWPDPDGKDPVDDRLSEDPSVPVEDQVCTVGYEWSDSPDILAFVMPYAGTATPVYQNWYWKNEGYRPRTSLVATYNSSVAWLNTSLLVGYSQVLGPCLGAQEGGIQFRATGKDSAGDWIVPGTYAHIATLTASDGVVMDCVVNLVIVPPAITIDPYSDDATVFEGDSGNKTFNISIESSGDAGSVLNWEVGSIDGDARLVSIVSVLPDSGSLSQGESETAVLTVTDPGSLSAGVYSASVEFRDKNLNSVSEVFTFTLTVLPLYLGSIKVQTHETAPGWIGRDVSVTGALTASATYYPYWVAQVSTGSQQVVGGRNNATGIWEWWWPEDQPTAGISTPTMAFRASDGYPSCEFTSVGPEGTGNVTRLITIGPDVW